MFYIPLVHRTFTLPSSDRELFIGGDINLNVLERLIKEAYSTEGLYAECKIVISKIDDLYKGETKYGFAIYKELWDLYRNFFGKENYHPYDKKHPAFFIKWADNFLNEQLRIRAEIKKLQTEEERKKKDFIIPESFLRA
jgi:hypothetical protein